MNRHVLPAADAAPAGDPALAAAAVITPSYADDFERCRLLCDTMDRFVGGMSHHYILVEQRDVARFRELESSRRTVVDERDILPKWLHAFDDPLSLFRKRIWLAWGAQPLRGWHVQQLRRIAIAAHVSQEVLVYCDSDVAFLKPFDLGVYRRGEKVRLFRRDDALLSRPRTHHDDWVRNSAAILGIPPGDITNHDYVTTLIAWRRRTVVDMCEHIERVTGKHWVKAVGGTRKFSECTIYGRYVDEITGGAHHFHGAEEWCRVAWFGEEMSDARFDQFVAGMTPEQVAICIQSFIKVDVAHIRRIIDRR